MSGLADAVLILHFLIAAFIVGGFVAIPLGAWLGWRWVRRSDFRLVHLAGIFIVAGEGAIGIACPLTVWEEALRGSAMEGGFIAFWLRRWLYYDIPPQVFFAIYVTAAVLAMVAWYTFPPQRRHKHRPR